MKLQEICFCGQTGDLGDREPILDGESRWALRCPKCGHLDYLRWLPEEAGFILWGEAGGRRASLSGRKHATLGK